MFANENHGEAGSLQRCNDQRTDQTAFLMGPTITDFVRNSKREKLADAIEKRNLEWNKDKDRTKCNRSRLNIGPLLRGNAFYTNSPTRVKRRMQLE